EAALREGLKLLPTDQLAPLALAHLHFMKGGTTDVREAFVEAEKSAKNSIDLRRQRGELFFSQDQFPEAREAFEGALLLAPRSPYLHARAAYTLYLIGDPPKALEHAEKASQL